MARWVGFCAPGRLPLAWFQVLSDPDLLGNVAVIYEEPNLAGNTNLVLVDLDAMDDYARELAESVISTPVQAWPDGQPVTPWADPWHDILGDLRQAGEDT